MELELALEELRARDSWCQGMLVLGMAFRARTEELARCSEELAVRFGARRLALAGRIRARMTELAELFGARCTEPTELAERCAWLIVRS